MEFDRRVVMDANLSKWVEENKLTVSESSNGGLDVVAVDGFGEFLYTHKFENDIIDEDFSFILSDEEFDALDEGKFQYILFEFGGKFYYSGLKKSKNDYNEIIYKPEFNDFKYIGVCSEKAVLPFSHIGIHDEYEIMNGSGSCSLWAKKAKFLGIDTIGTCNKNTLANVISFNDACKKNKLKPIFGETITVAYNYDKDKDIQETFDLKIYITEDCGWKNMLYISKLINVDYDKFIPFEELSKYTSGLIAVIPKESYLNYMIDRGDLKEAKNILKLHKSIFSTIYYQIDTLEYQSKSLFKKHLNQLDQYLINFKKLVKPILINDSYYLDKEELGVKGMLNKVNGKALPEAVDQYFKSANDTFESYSDWLDEVEPLFQVIVDGIDNARKFTESVNFKLDISERKIPAFEVKDVEEKFFTELQKGIEKRLIGKVKDIDTYYKRIETECELIVPNDLCSYFLILWDIINWCDKENIMVGPGRGSVCGSLVAYCLGITQIDPIPYQLYFERFLNKSRVSAHHSYSLVLNDGSEIEFRDGDKVPIIGGDEVEVDDSIDWKTIDIDVKRIVK